MNVPNNYRVTTEDVDRGYKLFLRQSGIGDGPEPTEDEAYLAQILIDAGHIHGKTGVWPTVGQVLAVWKQEAHDRERKRIESWEDEVRIRATDFTCYDEQLASGDTDGPFVRFMRVAADLKTSGKQLTVGDVR